MERYWFCPNDNVKLQQYTNRYSSNSLFTIRRDKIDVSLNNAAAVKKINLNSMELGKQLAEEYFASFPEAEELECLGTICPKCNKVYVSPKNIRTNEIGNIELNRYKHYWIFRVPVAEKDQEDQRNNYYLFFFRYLLYAYILNYTILLEMKLLGKYRKVGLYVIFPIFLILFTYVLVSYGFFGI